MITLTPKGLYCRAGDFYIDPCRAVDRAVVTHAHSDHARRGSKLYYCAKPGVSVLKVRLGKNISVQGMEYGKPFYIGSVKVSFHSAGHILGSAQVRIEYNGEVWVASGDYKRDSDPTCHPFEVVPCDTFITEATFGTPAYRWQKNVDLGKQIFDWWQRNAADGINSVLFAYSLGKAQRVLGVLKPFAERPIYCDTPVTPINNCYRDEGVPLAETICISEIDPAKRMNGELFLVPQSFLKSDRARALGNRFETAFASGWMATGHHGYSQGFVMSDHADWNDLLQTIKETGAKKVFVQHRGKGALVRHLKSIGIDAYPDTALIFEEPAQMEFF